MLGQSITLADTGPLPSSGGSQDASLLTVTVPGLLTANVLHATTVAHGNASSAEASVADLNLIVAGNTIAADFLLARAEAQCVNNTEAASGSSEIARLSINGQSIVVAGTPNETVALPVGAVIINEQDSARPGDLTVNALHVIVPGIADVVVSSAHADINGCKGQPQCDATKDFVTGGGWIATSTGVKGTFGVAGGIKNGAFWGHLEYIDHGTGMKGHGTGVNAYVIVSETMRHIEGTAEVNGQSGFTYQADVTDNGEPGTNDAFNLRVSNGYAVGGTLKGGNIQIHKPC